MIPPAHLPEAPQSRAEIPTQEALSIEKSLEGKSGHLLILLRWLGTLAVLALLFHLIPFASLRAAMSRVPFTRFAAVLILYLLTLTVAVAKWHFVVNTAGARLKFAASAQCFTSGLFGDLFLPSVIGGDIARLAVGISRSRYPAAVIAGNVADRLLDASAQVTLICLGLFLLPHSLPLALQASARRLLIFGAVGAPALVVVCLVFYRKVLGGRSIRFRRRMGQARHAFRAVARRPQNLLAGWILGIFIQSMYVTLTALLGISCGLVLPLRVWLIAWPLAKIAAVLPISQGGIGVREAALVLLLAPFGAPAAVVLATGIVWEGVIIMGGLISGVAAFFLSRQFSPRTNP